MDNIEYVEENNKAVVATLELPLDGSRMSEKELENKIFETLEAAGYDLGDKSELEIGYEGAESFEEGMSTQVVVTRNVKEIVPYEVEREEVFTGSFILDNLRMSEDDQKRQIFMMMMNAGIEIDPSVEYEIGYDGADDFEDGMTVNFVVYEVNRRRLEDANGFDAERDVFYEEEDNVEEIFTGSFILDDTTMTEEKQREKVFSMMRTAGMTVVDDDSIEINYEGAENFEDGMSTKFVVLKRTKKLLPYVVTNAKVFSGEYVLNSDNISLPPQKEEILDLMRSNGMTIDEDSEYEIYYEEPEKYKIGMPVSFDVYKIDKKHVDESGNLVERVDVTGVSRGSELPSEVVEVEEILMEEIVNGFIDLGELEDKKDIDEKVFDILKVSGVEVENIGEIKITYGEETDDKRLPFTVSRITVEKVKYNVEKKLVGTGIRKGKEDIYAAVQRNQGLDIRMDPNFEVVYGKINGDDREYSLIRTRRTEIESTMIENKGTTILDSKNNEVTKSDKKQDKNIMEVSDELSKIRDSLAALADFSKNQQIDTLLNTISNLEDKTSGTNLMTDEIKMELAGIDAQIRTIRSDIKEAEKEYENIFKKIKKIVKDENKRLDATGLLSEDEIVELKAETNAEKISQNDLAVAIENRIHQKKNQLRYLIKKKNDIEKNIRKAEALGLTVTEYQEIAKVMRKRKVLDAVLNRKGLAEVVEKPASTRTAEEKERLREAKEEVIKEIAAMQNNNLPKPSVLESISALYGIDPVAIMELESGVRRLIVPDGKLKTIGDKSLTLPEKIVNNNSLLKSEYVPGKAPTDMVEVRNYKEKQSLDSNKKSVEKIVIYIDPESGKKYAKKSVLNRFNASMLGNGVRLNNVLCYELSEDDADFIMGNSNNDYSPYNVELESVHLDKSSDIDDVVEEVKDNLEKITIYVDLDSNEKYAKKSVFNRFNASILGDFETIEGFSCSKISDDDLDFIINNASNDYSPYNVEYKEVSLGKNNVEDSEEESISNETITIYIALNNGNKLYVNADILDKFGITLEGEPTVIEGNTCYRLGKDALNNVFEIVDSSIDPKLDIEYKEVNLENVYEEENVETEVNEEEIVLFRDLNDNNSLYASMDTLRKFNIRPTTSGKVIDGKDCYVISNETDQMINYVAKNSVNPKYTVKYEKVKLKKKVVPHVETILDKLTTGLEIRAKDAKKFNASNLKISKNFKEELRSGNYLYNIIHVVKASVKAGTNFLRKIAAKLMTTKRIKEVMTEFNNRLYNDLSEEELDVLFDEYKGSLLKTDMNNQINGMILQRLREHGLKKVNTLNEDIKYSYANIFSLLGQIKALDQELLDKDLEPDMKEALLAERSNLVDVAADFVKKVLDNRRDANNLLSGGVHGLEEDFKAVATKLSYVGMRFAKTNNFDNDLQHQLSEYGEGLNEALAAGDNEAILNNFMDLESCYYDNTKIVKSITGKKSVGSKYYSPLAEQFDYRDDPFISDLLTTAVVASATISAVNASFVHNVESQELLRKHQEETMNVNSSNDSIMEYVHQTGSDIQDKRSVFQDGMEAQAHQDVLNTTNAIERAELDMSNWTFNGVYHAADETGHAFFNGFNKEVTSQINDITARYGNGTINQIEALQEMSDLANSAQDTLAKVAIECNDILTVYLENHPKIDLGAMRESLEYIVNNPDAISDMNRAMVDVTNLAGGLDGLTVNHVEALASLPSDMLSTLACAASAASLAIRVSDSMATKYTKKGNYGNEITDMLDDYRNVRDDDPLDDYSVEIEDMLDGYAYDFEDSSEDTSIKNR